MTATPDRQLAGVLRSLHLTGMLDTLEIRLAEARTGKLGHVEFLQVLLEDEIARRDAAAVRRRLRAAGFPTEATLEGFDFSYNKRLPAATIRDLARLEFVQAGQGLLLYGPVGVGKSHIACGLGYAACRRGYDVLLATNMISVGVDVPRLGLMVVGGQPKATAEYIQATSRVGRDARGPGLVITVLNWARPRDLSHYETFEHFHATFARHVEALSVTPYAPRALDRGLTAVAIAMIRHQSETTNPNAAPQRLDVQAVAKRAVAEMKK